MTHNARVQVFLSVDFNTRAQRANKISSAKFAEKESKRTKTHKKQKYKRLAFVSILFALLCKLTWNARYNVCVKYAET